jgi:hypothetical protein
VALTAALEDLQTDLGVTATGAVDAARLAAAEQAITEAKTATTTTTAADEVHTFASLAQVTDWRDRRRGS